MTTPVVRVPVVRVRQTSIPLPAPMSPGAAGLALAADVHGELTLAGYEGQVRPRSGFAHKTGVTVLNAPGTIDSDYRGEVQVLLVNLGSDDVVLRRGDRIAQLVVAPVTRIEWAEAATLAETDRGAGGFGSTGPR